MKKMIAIAVMSIISFSAAFAAVDNGVNEGVWVTPTTTQSKMAKTGPQWGGRVQINSLLPAEKPEAVIIASLVASSSPNKVASQLSAMAGMVGSAVETDRTSSPSAWYVIPEMEWQLFDGVTTSFKSWMGDTFTTNIATAGEYGHRIVIHCSGKYPVSKYWCKVTTTCTNIGDSLFPVGINSSNGVPLVFNKNFVGISFGPNGQNESTINPVTGVWIQGGDDKIFSNGEGTATNTYDWWYRFGATISVNISATSGFRGLQEEFASGVQTLKAELISREIAGDVIVSSRTITSAQPWLRIMNHGQDVHLHVAGGQKLLVYGVEAKNTVDSSSSWEDLRYTVSFGQMWKIPNDNRTMRFFRIKALAP